MDAEERAFLHDISNPLSVAYGNMQLLISRLEPGELLQKAQKSLKHLEEAIRLLEARRAVLRSREKG